MEIRGTANISIRDLDYLRECEEELTEIKSVLSKITKSSVEDEYDENYNAGDKIILTSSKEELKKLIVKYFDYENALYDFIRDKAKLEDIDLMIE